MLRRLLRLLGLGRSGDAPADEDRYGVMAAADAIRFERRLPGSPDRVWSQLVRSEPRATWLAAGPCDPWIGGRLELHFARADASATKGTTPSRFADPAHDHVVPGRVTRYESERRLAFTWGDVGEVTFELAPEAGTTRLTVTHRGLADRGTLVDVASGCTRTSTSSRLDWRAESRHRSGLRRRAGGGRTSGGSPRPSASRGCCRRPAGAEGARGRCRRSPLAPLPIP